MYKKIVISPWSKKLRNDGFNSKNYPYWNKLVKKLKNAGAYVIQIGVEGEPSIDADEFLKDRTITQLKEIILSSDIWISVDNFLPHFCNLLGKRGIVIFGKSNPDIFGYPQNLNILKDRKYLRQNQFDIWESESYEPIVFLSADEIFKLIELDNQ